LPSALPQWKTFIVRGDEKLIAFMELEAAIYQFAVDSVL
jgi:hypothetical protein